MINKDSLVDSISEMCSTKKDAQTVVNTIFTTINDALAKGEEVSVYGFGSFGVKERAARTGRNPQTGKELKIPAKKIPYWKPAKAVKDRVK
jgi:DNA-binding protein HU-beta